MKATIPSLVLLLAACVGSRGTGGLSKEVMRAHGDLQVWREFVELLESGPVPSERVAPYLEDLREPLLGFLGTLRSKADWDEWHREPEVFRVGDQMHYLIHLTYDGSTRTYCFSFVTGEGAWRFQHLEGITLRLDQVGPLPATRFPDLPEQDKTWMRQETLISREVWLFNALAAEKGRDSALEWFRDGAGYALAARSWVPFVSPSRAFILYLCWEQANLHGGEVTLVRLDDERAEVRMRPLYFAVYERAAHLKQQIPLADYRRLFEFRWQDRATRAGWALETAYEGGDCVFRFSKPPHWRVPSHRGRTVE